VHGYTWTLPSDVWRQRGDLDAAHLSVDYGLDLALQALFLINGLQVPYVKWRLFLATGVAWQPARLRKRLAEILRVARDETTLDGRVATLRGIAGDLAKEAERRRLLRGDIYRAWCRQSDDYTTTR
jgi:hypothetical protein